MPGTVGAAAEDFPALQHFQQDHRYRGDAAGKACPRSAGRSAGRGARGEGRGLSGSGSHLLSAGVLLLASAPRRIRASAARGSLSPSVTSTLAERGSGALKRAPQFAFGRCVLEMRTRLDVGDGREPALRPLRRIPAPGPGLAPSASRGLRLRGQLAGPRAPPGTEGRATFGQTGEGAGGRREPGPSGFPRLGVSPPRFSTRLCRGHVPSGPSSCPSSL